MTKDWKLRKAINQTADKNLKDYPPLLRKLLFYRDIKKTNQAKVYLEPDYNRDLLDPFLLKDMDKAVSRLLLAIERQEKIIIFGDYDADGIPGAALLAIFLKKINFQNFEVYIPDRHNEDYGLSLQSIENFSQNGVNLIITVDCGITDVAEIELANKKGIDVIITDHHLVPAELPPALAIINAKQQDDDYPEKMLAGAGVVFKFICAVLKTERFGLPLGWEKWLLDFVAIATVSDMVPLTGENRLLAYYGLKVLRQTKCLGLLILLDLIKIKPHNVTEDDISFMLGPRINSASRLSHASQAYYLLTTKDKDEAIEIAKHLEEKNRERREMVEAIIDEVANQIEVDKLPAIVIAGSTDWGLGTLGLASSRLVEKYSRPVWLWSQNGNGVIKGSCRSDGSINTVELMSLAGGSDFFANFGGHAMAGGFSLLADKLSELGPRLLSAHQKIKKAKTKTELLVDEELTLDQLNWSTYKLIEKMAPFGIGNPKPIFLVRGVEIFSAKSFGNGGLHLELIFKKTTGEKISAIGFFLCLPGEFDGQNGHHFRGVNLLAGEKIDLLVTLEKSTFKNYPELRLRIVDLRVAN